MAQNTKLCVMCCYSYYSPTPKNISYNIRHHLSRFCKELQLEQLAEGDPPDPLQSGSTNIKALNAFFNGLEAFIALSICPHCVSLISSAMDVKDKASQVEQRVIQLQLELLRELKKLDKDMTDFHLQMRRIEEVVETGDVNCLKEYMSDCSLPPEDDLKYSSVVLNFRESVVNAMDDLQQYREALRDKVNCAPYRSIGVSEHVVVKDEAPDNAPPEYDFDIEFAQEYDENEEEEGEASGSGIMDIELEDEGDEEVEDDGAVDGGFDDEVQYDNTYVEGFTDDDSIAEGDDSPTYNTHNPPEESNQFSSKATIIVIQGSEPGVPYTPYNPTLETRQQLPQAKNKPPGISTAYFSWMEFETLIINGKKKLLCDICDRPMANKQAVLNHKWTHLNEVEAAEAVAQGGIDPRVRFLQYKAEGRFAVPCPICGRVCSQSSVLKLHMRIHQKVQIMCPMCRKKFETEEGITRHQAESCYVGVDPRFQCPYCTHVFKTILKFQEHVETAHTIDKPFLCSVCGQGFTTAPELKTHAKHHKSAEVGGSGGTKKRRATEEV